MSKAILILDEKPITCWDCPCHDSEFDVCQVYKVGMPYDSDNCPLKPMPEKKDTFCGSSYDIIENRGYNICIDEILGEEE